MTIHNIERILHCRYHQRPNDFKVPYCPQCEGDVEMEWTQDMSWYSCPNGHQNLPVWRPVKDGGCPFPWLHVD